MVCEKLLNRFSGKDFYQFIYQWLAILIISFSNGKTKAQCPSSINTGGPFIINNGDNCTITSRTTTSAHTTIKDGGILILDESFTQQIVGGTIIVEDGGYLEIRSNAMIRDGGFLTIESGGTVLITGFFADGNLSNNETGTLHVDGTLIIQQDFRLQALGVLSGSGLIQVTNNVEDNGGDHTNWNGTITCGGSCDPLPVELISFTVEYQDHLPILKWKTASELNNSGFFIEKSKDGISFEIIGFVYGAGTTNSETSYRYEDRSNTLGSFYRLRQEDYDGLFEYSPTIKLKAHFEQEFSVYPTHFENTLHLKGQDGTPIDLELFDPSRRSVLKASDHSLMKLEQIINDKLHQLIPSVYFLKVQSDGQISVIKIIKGKN